MARWKSQGGYTIYSNLRANKYANERMPKVGIVMMNSGNWPQPSVFRACYYFIVMNFNSVVSRTLHEIKEPKYAQHFRATCARMALLSLYTLRIRDVCFKQSLPALPSLPFSGFSISCCVCALSPMKNPWARKLIWQRYNSFLWINIFCCE